MSVNERQATVGTSERESDPIVRILERGRNLGVVGIVVVLFVIFSFTSDAFLSVTNLTNIIDQWSAVGIVAVAGTLVLISGGFDLSVAAVFSIAGVVAAKAVPEIGAYNSLLLGVLAGVVFGFINGFIVVVWKINSIIATLATAIIIGALAVQISAGTLLTVDDERFSELGNAEFLGMSVLSWIFIVVILVFGFLLHGTSFGRHLYAVGGNSEAARLAGIRTDRVVVLVYMLSGFAAALAGVIVASRQSTGQANAIPGLEFDVIAAIIVGGTSILGGSGAVWRTVVGLALLALIQNGANLLGVSQTTQQIVYGSIIIFAAALDVWAYRRSSSG